MVIGVQELLASIRNTHTLCTPVLFNINDNEELKAQFQFYPVMYYPFSDGLYVAAAAERYEPILGKRVVRMGKLTSAEVMRELARFVAADNENTVLANMPRFFLNDGQLLRYIGASDSPNSMTLTLENDDNSMFDYEIKTDPNYGTADVSWLSMVRSSDEPPLYKRHRNKNYWFEYLPEQRAVYLQINLMNDIDTDPFPTFCGRLFDTLDAKKAEKLILDVRGCPGGDHIELPLLKGILARPHIDRADRLFLIIGRMTGSASQHLTSEFEHYTNATLFGEATASRPNQYGSMQRFTLPHSKLEIVCALKYFQDAEPTDYSVAGTPDIYVPRNSSDARENRDPVMERIFTYDSYKHLKGDFKERLSQAYMESGIDGFKRAYDSVKATCVEHGLNMETFLYKDLDAWMGRNRRSDEDYVEYLKFIHHELPNSMDVCYDLAYWMNERGDREEARRLWEQCLSLNPEHHKAKWRLGLMRLEDKWKSVN
jgi:tetratricopeptide (TPR) repeat protein